jgi:alkanesulfonate monooxygenase SsuD/methylene tetrahydromethanopterin reductase-like flavin-dependent oxidoreductase (luciferase family)
MLYASERIGEDVMKVGIALNMLSKPGLSDAAVFAEHVALGDLAEPLGFDSLWALEHHFTGYAMSPHPLQLLSYFAGRTRRLALGTAVIVLPWHDPVRVAEEIALLDVLSGGRCLFGFGRGAASVEYAGMRVAMEQARARFVESAKIVVEALTHDAFEWDGEFYQIPRTSIRPRPISHPERRFYASSVSPESAEVMARLGFGVLVIMQNEWAKAAQDIERYRELASSLGYAPRPPIILTNISVAESRPEAHERAAQYLSRKWDSIDAHYHFSDGHLASVKGYEFYAGMAKTYAKMKDEGFRKKATDFYVKIQIVGTPDDCVQQVAELRRLTGVDHLVTEFGYGGMPHEHAELNMRLFADRVVPVLQRDPAFAAPVTPTATASSASAGSGIFAPA